MCVSQELEDIEDGVTIDKNLLVLWRQWRRYLSLCLIDPDMPDVDWIRSFCTDMRKALNRLKAEGRLPGITESRTPWE